MIDDVTVDLGPRERDVVAHLLRRPGAVVPWGELLDEVWRGEAGTHAVEATINRLRRRLTETAIRVETVPKRGYRLVPADGAAWSFPAAGKSIRGLNNFLPEAADRETWDHLATHPPPVSEPRAPAGCGRSSPAC